YPEMFVLASVGAGRGQMQVFNRYDRCCFANAVGKLYEQPVRDAARTLDARARFSVLIDESHARHKVSERALDAILQDMEDPG
ncbi:MAG: alpha/beta hydrolase, partial [Alphaproteobacteria bacterium]|nr:alpha/beta hydrolase [Alphaproteobacteria bacterium]